MFFPDTGIPILNKARISVRLEVWLPEPLIVATVMLKLLVTARSGSFTCKLDASDFKTISPP